MIYALHKDSHIFYFFNDTATTEIYTLSLHDALPISSSCAATSTPTDRRRWTTWPGGSASRWHRFGAGSLRSPATSRSEEHTSELQSRQYLVCRLLLEKKKQYAKHVGKCHQPDEKSNP